MFDLHQFIYTCNSSPRHVTRAQSMAESWKKQISCAYSNGDHDFHEYVLDGITYHSPYHPNSPECVQNLSCVEGFILSKNKASFRVRRKNNATYLLLFTYDGEGEMEYQQKKYTLTEGQGMFIDCRQPHAYRTKGESWTHFDLHLNGYFSQKVYEQLNLHSQYLFSFPPEGAFQQHLETLTALYNDISPQRELLLSSQIDSILSMLLSAQLQNQQTIQNFPENLTYLIRYINANYSKDLSLDFLSDFSGISKSHMSRLFHQFLHCPPKEYIIQLRLKNAKRLLLDTMLPVNKIGAVSGFENENYFRHLFKARFGVTPTEYRKSECP